MILLEDLVALVAVVGLHEENSLKVVLLGEPVSKSVKDC